MKNQELFYATKHDLEESIQRVEDVIELEYCETGSKDDPVFNTYSSYKEIPNFGVSVDGKYESLPFYLVYKKGNVVIPKQVPQRKGGIRHIVSATNIPEFAIYIKFSGEYKEQCLIYGVVYKTNNELYSIFQKNFFKGYKKVRSFKVGAEALELLDKGFPLTPNSNADPAMYLQR